MLGLKLGLGNDGVVEEATPVPAVNLVKADGTTPRVRADGSTPRTRGD